MDNACSTSTQVVFLVPRTPTKRRSSSTRSRTTKPHNNLQHKKESSTSRTRPSVCSNSRLVHSTACTPTKAQDHETTQLKAPTSSPGKPFRVSPSKRVARALFSEDNEQGPDENPKSMLNGRVSNENDDMASLDTKPISLLVPNGVHSTVPLSPPHFPNVTTDFAPRNLRSSPTKAKTPPAPYENSKPKPAHPDDDAKPFRNRAQHRSARKLDDDSDAVSSARPRASKSKPPRRARPGRPRRSFSAESEKHLNHSITDYFSVVRRSARTTEKDRHKCEAEHMEALLVEGAELEREPERCGVRVCDVPGKGRGVFAARRFARGEFVLEYSGDLLSAAEAHAREEVYAGDTERFGCYMYFFKHRDRAFCLDATAESGRLGRLVNHSRLAPNCATRVVELSEAALARLLTSTSASDVKPRLATTLLQQSRSPTASTEQKQNAIVKVKSEASRSPQQRVKSESPSDNKNKSPVKLEDDVREEVKALLRKCERAHPFAGSDLSQELLRTRLILVAKRDIESGEELLYDYGDRSPESLKAHPWLATS